MGRASDETYAEHLSGMVRFPTRSNADDSLVDYSVFEAFHRYLEETYPLVHSHLDKKVIGKASLLYRWKGRETGKLPLLLMAHQDVVPEGDPDKWTYPPYAGVIADGLVWGRGASDCKSVMLSELEIIEELLGDGFEPDYDIYLAFGHNEEVQAPVKGAQQIVEYLKSRGVRPGAVFDEGSGVSSGEKFGFPGYICDIRLGEKGYEDFELYKDTPGGHSMMPGQGTALGSVAKAVVAVEANPLPYRLTELTRAWLVARSAAMSGEKKAWYAEPEKYWDELTALAKQDKELDSQLHTTFAVTMASGSSQSNVLPTHASAIVNARLLQGDTEESLLKHFRSVIPEDVSVRRINGEDPLPASRPGGAVYDLIVDIAKEKYGDALLVIPSLLAGGTDAKFYPEICDNVFRYTGAFRDERWKGAHGIDEVVPVDLIHTMVDFYRSLIRRYQALAPEALASGGKER